MIVVTGSAGFVGSHLLASLRAAGKEVVGIDRRPSAAGGCITADLNSNSQDVLHVLGAAATVFHLAARPGVRARRDVSKERRLDNIRATSSVLRAVSADAHLVVTSSSSVYGGCKLGDMSSESDELAPRGEYARSKVAVERLCKVRASRGGSTLVVRPFTIVGPGQRDDMALRVWTDAAVRGKPIVVFGSLRRARDLIHVNDVVRSLVSLADQRVQGTINLGTGVPRSLDEMVHAVTAVFGNCEVTLESAAAEEVAVSCADTSRLGQFVDEIKPPDLIEVVESLRG